MAFSRPCERCDGEIYYRTMDDDVHRTHESLEECIRSLADRLAEAKSAPVTIQPSHGSWCCGPLE